MAKNDEKRIAAGIYARLSMIAAVALVAVAGVAWFAGDFAKSQVKTELGAQNIYFPEKGSAALDPKEFPDLQQYAGQKVDDGPKAQAYANGFIGRHLKKTAAGKTYAEISSLAMKDPENTKLQQQKQTLFQGETLRGLLLGDGYGYWTIGNIAQCVALVMLAAAVVLAMIAYRQTVKSKKA